jgi:hypothetical protein
MKVTLGHAPSSGDREVDVVESRVLLGVATGEVRWRMASRESRLQRTRRTRNAMVAAHDACGETDRSPLEVPYPTRDCGPHCTR